MKISLNKDLQLIDSATIFYGRVFQQYSESTLTAKSFENLNKERKITFLTDVKKGCQLNVKFMNIWTRSRDNNTTEISLVSEIMEKYQHYLPSTDQVNTMKKKYWKSLKDQSEIEYARKNNECLVSGIKQYLHDFHQFYCLELERIRLARLPNDVEKELKTKLVVLCNESESEVIKIIDQLVHEKDYQLIKCLNDLYIGNENKQITKRLLERIELLFSEKMSNKIEIDKIKDTTEVLFDCYDILKQLKNCLSGEIIVQLDSLFKQELIKQSTALNDTDNSLFPMLLSKYPKLLSLISTLLDIPFSSNTTVLYPFSFTLPIPTNFIFKTFPSSISTSHSSPLFNPCKNTSLSSFDISLYSWKCIK